jgi:hypothetical protein
MPPTGSIENVVEAAVQAQVQKMIVESLEGVDGMVGRLVAGAMQAPVKDNYREIPFIQKLCRETVQTAATTAMKGWMEKNGPALQAEVERQLTAQKKDVASALVLSLAKAAGNVYQFKVVIKERNED